MTVMYSDSNGLKIRVDGVWSIVTGDNDSVLLIGASEHNCLTITSEYHNEKIKATSCRIRMHIIKGGITVI